MTGGVLTLVGVAIVQWVFATVGATWPAPRWYFWCDAWIFVGSIVATYAMARGWNEFWLAWIAVDLVGVPLLLKDIVDALSFKPGDTAADHCNR